MAAALAVEWGLETGAALAVGGIHLAALAVDRALEHPQLRLDLRPVAKLANDRLHSNSKDRPHRGSRQTHRKNCTEIPVRKLLAH